MTANDAQGGRSVTRAEIERLHALMLRCFKHDGPYTLSSGRTAAYYYDGKLATLDPEAAALIGVALADVVLDLGAEAVGGPEIGAIPISDAVGAAAWRRGRRLPTFIVRKAPKGHGTRTQVAEAWVPDPPLVREGRRVVIVEDVITTGGSIQQAVDVVRELGCELVGIIALVERHESERKALRHLGVPVLAPFYTDEAGRLYIDEDFVRRAEAAAAALAAR
jgi:orotate phosphoribosyltransferase